MSLSTKSASQQRETIDAAGAPAGFCLRTVEMSRRCCRGQLPDAGWAVDVLRTRVRETRIVLGPGLSASEVHRKAEVRADANGPRDDLSMFNGDPYQESMELLEPPFPLIGRYNCPGMARSV